MLRTVFRYRQPLDGAERRNTAACPASLRRRDIASLAHSVPRQRKNPMPGSGRIKRTLANDTDVHQNHARQAPIRLAILPSSSDAPDWGTHQGHTEAREGESGYLHFREMRNFDEKLRNSLNPLFQPICFYKTHEQAVTKTSCFGTDKLPTGKPATPSFRFALGPPSPEKYGRISA